MTGNRAAAQRRWGRALAIGGALLLSVLTIDVGVSGAEIEDSTPELQVRAIDNRGGRLVVDYVYTGDGDAAATQAMPVSPPASLACATTAST